MNPKKRKNSNDQYTYKLHAGEIDCYFCPDCNMEVDKKDIGQNHKTGSYKRYHRVNEVFCYHQIKGKCPFCDKRISWEKVSVPHKCKKITTNANASNIHGYTGMPSSNDPQNNPNPLHIGNIQTGPNLYSPWPSHNGQDFVYENGASHLMTYKNVQVHNHPSNNSNGYGMDSNTPVDGTNNSNDLDLDKVLKPDQDYGNLTAEKAFIRTLDASSVSSHGYYLLSDARFKREIQDLDPKDAQLLISSLKFYVYRYLDSNDEQSIGTLAQDIANDRTIPDYIKNIVLRRQPSDDPRTPDKIKYVVNYDAIFLLNLARDLNEDAVFTGVLCRTDYTPLWHIFPHNIEGTLKVNPYRLMFYTLDTHESIIIKHDQIHHVAHVRMQGDIGKQWTMIGYSDEHGNRKSMYFVIYREFVRFPLFGGGHKLFAAVEKSFPDKRHRVYAPPQPHCLCILGWFIGLMITFMVSFIVLVASVNAMVPEHSKEDLDVFLEEYVIPPLMIILVFVVVCLFFFYFHQAARKT